MLGGGWVQAACRSDDCRSFDEESTSEHVVAGDAGGVEGITEWRTDWCGGIESRAVECCAQKKEQAVQKTDRIRNNTSPALVSRGFTE